MILTIIAAGLAFLSLAITFWQWAVARHFPLHQRTSPGGFAPPVTLLKPLKGWDAATSDCLASWFEQQYPGPIQILLGVASPDDPVCGLARKLIADHPTIDAQLVICTETLSVNAKVSTLIQLERQIRHDVVVISDADVWAPADYLANAVLPLRQAKVGLVNSFYSLANASKLAMRWEAVAINADFWSQVLQSQTLKPLDFALGAAMTVRREALTKIGGFTALADYLADDYQLGHKIAQNGWTVALCPVVVECRESPQSWASVWAHQLRWARTIRICQPAPYFFSILSNATLWPALLLAVNHNQGAILAVLLCFTFRMITALYHQSRLTRSKGHLLYDWLVLLKDLLQVALWIGAFLGNTVEWRGIRYRILPGGKLARDQK